jgi:hypothetical protein
MRKGLERIARSISGVGLAAVGTHLVIHGHTLAGGWLIVIGVIYA